MDGSSSIKILDEMEVYIIKTCLGGAPKYEVISLEEPQEGWVKRSSVSKMNFNFQRKTKEIGMCGDGAAVIKALYRLVEQEMGEHHLLVLCPSHKLELALGDTFKDCNLNNLCEKDYRDIYYLFRKAP